MTERERLIEKLGNFPVYPSTLSEVWMPETVAKLADHLLANGVIVPPCKAGGVIYCLHQECGEATKVIELEIDFFENHKDYIIIEGYIGEHCYRYFVHEIGKSVFLTRAEAEEKASSDLLRHNEEILNIEPASVLTEKGGAE